jgi:hypothetical protein
VNVTPVARSPGLLILGGPDSGKSTFRVQLYQRFEHRPGKLSLLKSVGDLTAIGEDVDRLNQGLQPMHTTSNTYVSTDFALKDSSGNQFNLDFADYDGEQLRRMSNGNAISAPWVERAVNADSWLLFIRIDNIRPVKSFMTSPVAAGQKATANGAAHESPVSAVGESGTIEMLQRLLFVRGTSLLNRIVTPKLAVLLSCWDELAPSERSFAPVDLLAARAPLLSRFLAGNWESASLQVWGLSSTEKPLPKDVPDVDFARRGAEAFGYIVVGAGEENKDLTIPIYWLLRPR